MHWPATNRSAPTDLPVVLRPIPCRYPQLDLPHCGFGETPVCPFRFPDLRLWVPQAYAVTIRRSGTSVNLL